MAPMLSQSLWSGGRRRARSNASPDAPPSTAPTATRSTPKSTSEHIKGTNRLLSIVGKALDRLSLSSEEHEAWDAIKRRVKEPERATASSPELQQIQAHLKELSTTVSKLVSTKSSTWAQVASLKNPLARALPRKSREMLVTCSPSNPARGPKTAAEAVQAIRSQPGGNNLIAGARKLPSGAFALIFKSAEAKRAWQEQGSLTSTFGTSARATETTLDVIVFGFPKGAISGVTTNERLGTITSQNPDYASSLRRVGVLKGPQAKSVEAVILGFSDPKSANQAIDQGVLWESSVLNAEPYTNGIRSRRCFKCQSYANHSARFCRSTARCGWCAQAGHTITECPSQHNPSAKACAPCGGAPGHCALDMHCPARARDDERARAVYTARLIRFEQLEHCYNDHQGPSPMQIFHGSPQRPENDTDNESFTIMGSKRRRGRPTTISIADISGIPSIASFLQIPSTQFTSTPLTSSQASALDEAMTDIVILDA
jgi:hypothetical protein